MKTITIINQKGGVAKSTTALAISQYYLLQGKKVLLIDLDAQANSTYASGGEVLKHGVIGVLMNPKTIQEEIFLQDKNKNMPNVLPATNQLINADTLLLNEVSKEYRLKIALEEINNKYDYCIIDTPPALSVLTINALVGANYCVIPTGADIYSIQGIGQLKNTIDAVKTYCNPNLNVIGLLITKYKQNQILSQSITEELKEIANVLQTRLFETKIRESVAIKESALKRQNMFIYKPTCNACIDYENFIKEMEKYINE